MKLAIECVLVAFLIFLILMVQAGALMAFTAEQDKHFLAECLLFNTPLILTVLYVLIRFFWIGL